MTDRRVSRTAVEVLVDQAPARRVSRAQAEALIDLNPPRRVSRVAVSALALVPPASLAKPVRWHDADARQIKTATLRGYWDAATSTVKPVTLRGYVEAGVLYSLGSKPAPTFYAGTASSSSSGTSFSLPIPPGSQPGDVAIAMFTSYGLFSAPPSGWTLIANDTPNRGQIVCHKTLVAGDTLCTVGGAWNSIDRITGTLGVYRGGVVQSTTGGTGPTSTNSNLPNTTTTDSNTMVVTVAGTNGTASDSQTMSGTGVTVRPGSDNRCTVGMVDQVVATAGATNTVTVSWSFSRSPWYTHFRLRPA